MDNGLADPRSQLKLLQQIWQYTESETSKYVISGKY